MPTPNDVPALQPVIQPSALSRAVQSQHATCPIDEQSQPETVPAIEQDPSNISSPANPQELAASQAPAAERDLHLTEPRPNHAQSVSEAQPEPTHTLRDPRISPSPERQVIVDESKRDGAQSAPIAIPTVNPTSSLPSNLHTPEFYDIPLRQLPKHTSSFLRNGSKFVGTQQSDRQVYNVEVDIKYVDMNESFICGYLRIEGLTADHPTLTTYFEGEIIGNKYSFRTRHDSWGSNEKVDMQHWSRFSAWRPLANRARKPDFSYKDFAEQEHIFMRWKEAFLVPDHRVRSISGASFEGFYYICFNQMTGHVSGIYFHSKSEKFQQLELHHVDDKGCFGALEFR